MKSSVVNIEGVNNSSFGTGFVIDSDKRGVYILTCGHVVDDVGTPVVENVLAKVVAKGKFIDMAVLYVSKLHLSPLPLQIDECDSLDVEVIGFSSFNKSLTQKKHIKAMLYQEAIELHSKENELFYTVRKIKADDGFNFDRGNSGSPVICKNSGRVIAMVSNKEGSDIGYAIDIVNLKTVWKSMPIHLLQKYSIKKVSSTPITSQINSPKQKSSFFKYLLLMILTATIFSIAYYYINSIKSNNTTSIVDMQKQKEIERQKRAKERLNNAINLEREAFEALIDGRYMDAKEMFQETERGYNQFDIANDVRRILNIYIGKMNNKKTKIKALKKIIKITRNSSKYITSQSLQRLIEKVDNMERFHSPIIPIFKDRNITIKRPLIDKKVILIDKIDRP
jgi:hypothetical protein